MMGLFDAFEDDARRAVVLAQDVARSEGAGEVEVTHLISGMAGVREGVAAAVLSEMGFSSAMLPSQPPSPDPVPFSPAARRALESSLREALQMGHKRVTTAHLLLAVVSDTSFRTSGAPLPGHEVRQRLMSRLAGDAPSKEPVTAGARPRRPDSGSVLARFSRDLNEEAASGRLPLLVGRDEEVGRMSQVLARQMKSNPLLVGDPGVGKTALVEGLAQRIVDGEAPDFLLGRRVVQLDLAALISGSRYRGDFEERLRVALEEARRDPSLLLFVDEIHTLSGVGAAEGAMDAASILKPMLARGDLQMIGATTFEEYRRHLSRDSAWERRFQVIEVKEPSVEDATAMLEGVMPAMSEHHGLAFAEGLAAAAVRLSVRFVPDRHLPDKALDLVDEAAALVRISPGERGVVEEHDLAKVLSSWTGIPVERVGSDEASRLSGMEDALSAGVVGQAEAVSAVSRAVRRARSGVRDPRRPVGSFLFAGPSGVGKTELAKSLSRFMFGSEDSFVRFDMSEFMERHTVARLVGSPPGYVGYGEGGQLTEAVRRSPYSLVLLDEIEKAHPDVFNLLLQVMEEGFLTDGQGRKVDFRNVILVMTSNLGTEGMGGPDVGFAGNGSPSARMRERAEKEVSRFFRPELRNRLDAMVVFSPLDEDALISVAGLMLKDVSERLASEQVELRFSEDVPRLVARQGFDPVMGARPMRRRIQSLVEDRISDLMLDGSLSRPCTIMLDTDGAEELLLEVLQ